MPKSSAAMPSDPDVDPDAPYLAVLLDFPNGPSSNAGHVQASDPVLASSGLEAFDLALQHHNFDSLQQPTTQLLLGSPDALVDGMLVETVSEAFGSSPQQHQSHTSAAAPVVDTGQAGPILPHAHELTLLEGMQSLTLASVSPVVAASPPALPVRPTRKVQLQQPRKEYSPQRVHHGLTGSGKKRKDLDHGVKVVASSLPMNWHPLAVQQHFDFSSTKFESSNIVLGPISRNKQQGTHSVTLRCPSTAVAQDLVNDDYFKTAHELGSRSSKLVVGAIAMRMGGGSKDEEKA